MEKVDAITIAIIKAFDINHKIEVSLCKHCDKKELGCNPAKCHVDEFDKEFLNG